MTKGQNAAVEFIENFHRGSESTFSWEELMSAVKESKAVVKNWMSIRGVVQWFIDECIIERTSSVKTEEYKRV